MASRSLSSGSVAVVFAGAEAGACVGAGAGLEEEAEELDGGSDREAMRASMSLTSVARAAAPAPLAAASAREGALGEPVALEGPPPAAVGPREAGASKEAMRASMSLMSLPRAASADAPALLAVAGVRESTLAKLGAMEEPTGEPVALGGPPPAAVGPREAGAPKEATRASRSSSPDMGRERAALERVTCAGEPGARVAPPEGAAEEAGCTAFRLARATDLRALLAAAAANK